MFFQCWAFKFVFNRSVSSTRKTTLELKKNLTHKCQYRSKHIKLLKSHFVVSNEIVQNNLFWQFAFLQATRDKVNLQENNVVEFCMQLLLYHQTNSVTISTMLFGSRTFCMVGVVFFVCVLLLYLKKKKRKSKNVSLINCWTVLLLFQQL